jgi:hypothetical protein
MFSDNSPAKWLWLLGMLVVANIAYYFYENWGLITVKVTDAPLAKVIQSIEWQGWVKIYTNLPLDTKVTMYCDHVPLAEAMETLAANVDVPPPTDDDGTRPRRNRPDGVAGAPNSNSPPNGGAPGGPPGGGGRGGGFGRAAQWNLAFFAAPTSAQVKQEISEFQTSDPNTDAKVYTYNTQLQLISSDDTSTAPDPRSQAWPGVKPVDPSATPAVAQANSTAPGQDGTAATDPPVDTPPTVQTYFQSLAEAANIWIMAPGSWAPEVANPPPANSSIVSAVEKLVSNSRGVVTEALVLRTGRGGPRGGDASPGNDDAWADRMRNAINGLPPDERPDALDHLNQEIQFRKDIQALPPEQRRQKFMQHMMERMIYGQRLSRLSPVKRAQVYQRMLALRAAAKNPK